MKKSFLFIINENIAGGAQRVAITLANYFSKKHNVTLLIFKKKNHFFSINKDVNIIYLRSKYIKFSILEVAKIIKNNRYDFIISKTQISNVILGFANLFFDKKKKILK